MGEIRHIFASTAELAVKCKRHPYLYHQAVKAVTMVQEARFRYSAPLTRWSDAQLAHLHTLWVANIKAAMGLSPGTAGCPFTLPVQLGGTPIRQPHVVLMQALSSHIHQVVQHNDSLRQQAKEAWRLLCLDLGTHKPQEMMPRLAAETNPRPCLFARFLRLAGQLGIIVTLPQVLTGEIADQETWEGLRIRLE